MRSMTRGFCALSVLIILVSGCQTAYYAMWEKLGKEKRHLLKDQVENVRNEQKEATEQFESVVERIQEVYGFHGGDLEDFYDELKSEYEQCEIRAQSVRERIDTVEEIAEDLFEEWEDEIEEIGNAQFKAESRRSLRETRTRYARLSRSMQQSERKMAPVLRNLNDYVLFLKHNLNARAIGALKREAGDIESEVESLIRDMQRSIQEADDFVKAI